MTHLDSILKSRDITLSTKVCLVKTVVFPVVMYGCESWTIKKTDTEELMLLNCDVGEDSWESLDSKEIQPVHPKGNQSWIFVERTDAEAEPPILWQSAFFKSNSHIHTWPQEKPKPWLDGPLLAKQCLCFSIYCLGWSELSFQGASVF